MKIKFVLACVAVAQLSLASASAIADWASDYRIGAKHAGIVDIGRVGSRKQVVLPPNGGEWKLLGAFASKYTTTASGRDSNRLVDLPYGNLVYANLSDDTRASIVLWASASLESTSGSVLPDVCVAKKGVAFQDLYPSFGSKLRPKCLTIELINPSALVEFERTALANQKVSFDGNYLVRATLATSDDRYGTLMITLTASAPTIDADYIKQVRQWANGYIESQLEASLARKLDTPLHREAFPIATAAVASNPAPTSSPAPAPLPSKQATSGKGEDVLSTIERLKSLKDRGVISEEEFSSKKAELLKRL